MAYRIGSQGEEVARIQERLAALGLYPGPIDGDFGGGTESAVKAFQRAAGVAVDGVVGPDTWARLFAGQTIPAPSIAAKPLEYRCLALTASFETGAGVPECFAGVSGDFDGQGISFGALQWNLGQGSLQRLLLELDRRSPALLDEVFHEHAATLRARLQDAPKAAAAWARSIQDPRRRTLDEPWRGLFKTLGRRPECHEVQVAFAADRYRRGLAMCREHRVRSERAAALMFDITVQNGSIKPGTRAQIADEFARLGGAGDEGDLEVARLRIIAGRVAEASSARWVEDVRRRKLTIANGQGEVHGRVYDLAGQYGIGLGPAPGVA